MKPQPAQTPRVIGNYQIVKRLAVGGMGEIFLARQIGMGGFERLVCVKTMLQVAKPDGQSVDQFFDEARVAATLNHPNIVAIYELGQHGELYFIAMEYIAGVDLHTLSKLLQRARVYVPPRIGAEIIRDAALALDYAHRATDLRGTPLTIVHRDVSPHNIMVRLDGGVKVVDFGIARAANRMAQTAGQVIKGKLLYMSPEQVRGQPLDGASDQFSLGVVAWELFTLKSLFMGDSPAQVMANVATQPIAPLTKVRRRFAPEMSALVGRMLERDRADRFASCADVANAMQAYLDGSGGSAWHELVALVKKLAGSEIAAQSDMAAVDDSEAKTRNAGARIACAQCGASAPRRAKFCPGCGALLAAASSTPPALCEPRVGSDRLPSLDLQQITRSVPSAETLSGDATVRDLGMSLDSDGNVIIPGGRQAVDSGGVAGPPARAPGAAEADGQNDSPEPALVGREAELDYLLQRLDATRQGHAQCVLMVGEEGIGKSRLARELATFAERRELIIAHALSARRGVPLALDLFRQWVVQIGQALAPGNGGAIADASTVAAALAGVPVEVAPVPLRQRLVHLFDGGPGESMGDPVSHGQRQAAALMHFLERASLARPLLLIADDIHDADPMSLELLPSIRQRLPAAPLFVLATASVGRAEQIQGDYDNLELPPLSLSDLRRIAQGMVGTGDLPREIAVQLEHLRGNPTVLVQLVRSVGSGFGTGPGSTPGRGTPNSPVLRRVSDCAGHMLRRLSPAAHDVIGAAALIGDGFSIALLEHVCPGTGNAVQAAVRDALQLGLFEAARASGTLLRFAQGSYRRQVLAALDPQTAVRLRGGLLATLQEATVLPPHEAREMSAFYALNDEVNSLTAIRQLADVATGLVRRGLLGRASEMLARVVEAAVGLLVVERGPDDGLAALLFGLGGTLAQCLQQTEPARAAALLLRLLDQVPPQRAAEARPEVFWRLAQCLRTSGQTQQAAAAIEQGLRCQALDRQPVLRAMLDAEKAQLLIAAGGHQGAVFLLTEALDTLGQIPVPAGGDPRLRFHQLGELYCLMARAHFGTGRSDRAQRAVDRARKVARFGDQLHDEVRALLCAADTTDDRDLVEICLSKAAAAAETLVDPVLSAEVYLACGRDQLTRDVRAASATLSKAEQAARLSGRRDLVQAAHGAAGGDRT